MWRPCVFSVFVFLSVSAQKLHFSNVFGSHMVLQAETSNLTAWGWGPPKTNITITLSNSSTTQSWWTISGVNDGLWRQRLPVLAAGSGPYTLEASILNGDKVSLSDILAGDVIWCAGQSNAQFSVVQAFNGTSEIASASAYPHIRIFTAGSSDKARTSRIELGHIEHPWAIASASTVGGAEWTSLGAQCWMTARRLADRLGPATPLGLINNNYGGTTIGSWLSTERFMACNSTHGEPPDIHGNNPTEMYNTFLTAYAVGPLSLKAFTWLQGEEEADLGYASFYPCAFPSLISQFRSLFDMSVSAPGFVGVIAVGAWVPHSSNGDLAFVRDVQLRTALSTPMMGWSTAADCGDATSPYTPIHFRDKETPSARLAASMLNVLYGQDVAGSAPLFRSAVASSGPPVAATIELTWDPLDSGPLQLRENVSCPSEISAEWCGTAQLQGSDSTWYDATVTLTSDGRGIVLTALGMPTASAPAVAATYGWMAWPLLTAYSSTSGFPVMPFNCSFTESSSCWDARETSRIAHR